MTNLLNATTATGSTATEGDVKTFLENMRTYIADLLGTDSANKGAVLGLLGSMLNGTMSKSASYTVVAADRGKVINCTGSGGWTLSVQAAATLGDGFVFAVSNVGSGIITLDPNLAEQVNGQNTFSIAPTDTVIVYCTGSEFLLFGKSPYPGKGEQVFTTSGTFTVPIGVRSVKVTIVGSGGGGGNASSTNSCGGGGGGGSVAIKTITGLIGSNTISVTIGSGGAPASAGGVTSFGSYFSVSGGGAGASNLGTTVGVGGGSPGTGSGDWVVSGSPGGGIGGDGTTSISGKGADFNLLSLFSGVGGRPIDGTSGNGISASGFGAGGSGAKRYLSGSYSGGSGAPGIVIVEW